MKCAIESMELLDYADNRIENLRKKGLGWKEKYEKVSDEFAESDPKYNNLLRDVDELAGDIDPYHVL